MFIMPAGRKSSYQITNSVRLRASASAYFNRTFGAGGDRDKWWILIPFKRSALGAAQYLFGADTASADAVYFNSSDKLCVDIAGTNRLISTRVFRDPSAWGAALVVYDASNGTADQRLRVYYIDNSFAELTAWDTNTRSGITAGTAKTTLNTAAAVIGKNPTAANSYFDGYLSHFHIGTWSGSQPTPASFGSNDANGVWVFNGASSAYGTQGSWLDFKDANLTAGSNVGLGKDVSGNGNYWNTNNISVTAGVTYDSMVDTPTNNYATLNPLDKATSTVLASANLNITVSGARSSIGTPSGAYYFECYIVAIGSSGSAHIALSDAFASTNFSGGSFYFYRDDGARSGGASFASYTTGDTIGVGFDAGAGTISFYKNNSLQATLTGCGFSTPWFPLVMPRPTSGDIAINFGQRPFTYTPPTGFKALCTANLPAVAIPKPSNGFKATLDTATNIDASVAAARSGWPAYVDIKKNRSAAASWQWQFSHDSTKEYAIASASVTNQAKSSNTGANNWVGYSIRIDSAYGTAAGSVTHTNGADTTVTHSVGVSARQLIFLFPRAGGTVVRVYHPDLTAGSLLDLCSPAAEAVNATIKTVLSTSFKIDSATASGTYDYLVISELSGFFKLGAYVGNAALDGTFTYDNLQPKARLVKRYEAGTNAWYIEDTARNTYNPVDAELSPNTNGLETSGAADFDFLSNGVKCRNSSTGTNNGSYVYGDFAAYPFGGSNVSPSPAR